MTKADLIEEITNKADIFTKKQTEVIVNTFFDIIKDTLSKGDKIEIRGFGSFKIRNRQPRIGRNPKTGTRVEVPGKKVPFFKVGKELKEMVEKSVPSP
ncbi:MAG: integration host factor subunit beta [Nitrospirota bacterium]